MSSVFIDHQPASHIIRPGNGIVASYTDSAPSEFDLPKYAIGLICTQDDQAASQVIALGSFRRSVRVTSFSRRYEISNLSALRNPVSLEYLYNALPSQIKRHVAPALSSKRALPDGSSVAVLRALTNLAQDAADLIARASGFPLSPSQATPGRNALLAKRRMLLWLSLSFLGSAETLGRLVGN